MPRQPFEIDALEIGHRYRVEWKHEWLRRSFLFVGTLVSVEDAAEDPEGYLLTFEVKPRFGSPATQRVGAATVWAIEPV